jgi:hypothetical protein
MKEMNIIGSNQAFFFDQEKFKIKELVEDFESS